MSSALLSSNSTVKERMLVLSNLRKCVPTYDAYAKQECNGWYKVDFNAYARQMLTNQEGNCYYTNWDYYNELKKTNKRVKLYIARLGTGFHHAFILDGDIMYDRSQHRDIKVPYAMWSKGNTVVGYSICNTKHQIKWLELCERAQEGKFDYKGAVKV